MEKHQIDQYDMLLVVENHFDDEQESWTTNPVVSAEKEKLTVNIQAISAKHVIQLQKITGTTKSKSEARVILEAQSFDLSAGLCTYATSIGNADLYDKVLFTLTDLARLREAELSDAAIGMLEVATTNILVLPPFGITQGLLDEYAISMSVFRELRRNPEGAIARRKAATKAIATLIPAAIIDLEKGMDHAVVALKATAPEFVAIYTNLRFINDSPTNPWSLTTTSIDSVSNKPVKDVILKVQGTATTRTSSTSGFNTFQNVTQGDHILVVEHPLYVIQNIPFTIVGSQTTELIIELILK